MKLFMLPPILILVGCEGTKPTLTTPKITALEEYAIIHKPAGGCPTGWKLEAGLFTERDGSKEDACHNPNKNTKYSLDVLKGGESYTIHIDLGIAGAPEGRKL